MKDGRAKERGGIEGDERDEVELCIPGVERSQKGVHLFDELRTKLHAVITKPQLGVRVERSCYVCLGVTMGEPVGMLGQLYERRQIGGFSFDREILIGWTIKMRRRGQQLAIKISRRQGTKTEQIIFQKFFKY